MFCLHTVVIYKFTSITLNYDINFVKYENTNISLNGLYFLKFFSKTIFRALYKHHYHTQTEYEIRMHIILFSEIL